MARGKKRKDLEYFSIEITHEIPRFVKLPTKKCTNVKTFKVICADCGYEDVIISGGCNDPSCFPCHVKWSKMQSHDAALRVMACLEQLPGTPSGLWRFVLSPSENTYDCLMPMGERFIADMLKDICKSDLWHFVLSPPENRGISPRDEVFLDEILRETYEMCKCNGIVGGCAVLHYGPERGRCGINKYLPEGEYRPHVHVFGFGARPRGPWLNWRGEWICKTLNNKKPVDRDFKFIRRGLHYQLSHALRRKGKHSIRWFGAFSYNKGIGSRDKLAELGLKMQWIEKIERLGQEIVCRCPRCGGDMICKTVYDPNGTERVGKK